MITIIISIATLFTGMLGTLVLNILKKQGFLEVSVENIEVEKIKI